MIRKATIQDMPEIERVYETARSFMAQNGNPTQWGTTYPEKEIILEDIEKERLFVLEEGSICGAFVFIEGPDPTYNKIFEGSWSSSEPYFAIHRVASDGSAKGFLKTAVAFCRERASHLRIDTHSDNIVMQGALLKCGFEKCGIIYLLNGEERIAYEFIAANS